MDNKPSNLSIVGLIVAVVALCGALAAVATRPTAVVQAPATGSVSSPDLASRYISWGGLRHWAARPSLNAGNQVLCTMQSPAATSTLTSFRVTITNNLAVTDLIQMGWSVTSGATTTLLGSFALPSLGTMSLISTSGPTTVLGSVAVEPNVVQPLTYFSVRIASGTPTSFAPTGHCSASWTEIN